MAVDGYSNEHLIIRIADGPARSDIRGDVIGDGYQPIETRPNLGRIKAHRRTVLRPLQHSFIFDRSRNTHQRNHHAGLDRLQQNARRTDRASQSTQNHVGIQHQSHIVCNIAQSSGMAKPTAAFDLRQVKIAFRGRANDHALTTR